MKITKKEIELIHKALDLYEDSIYGLEQKPSIGYYLLKQIDKLKKKLLGE